MTIQRLSLRNFKGAKSADYDIPEGTTVLEGCTGVGKTTVLEAITWCLYGKGLDREPLTPKPLDENNNVIQCDTSVEITFEKIKFKRVFREKWTTPKGKLDKEFSGHETDLYIDGLPMKLMDYNIQVNASVTERQFYVSAIPTYFGSDHLHWRDRRELLSQMFKKPDEADMIAELPDLKEILDGSDDGVYDLRLSKAKAELTKIKEGRVTLPARKDENYRLILPVEESKEELEAQVAELKQKIETYKNGGKDIEREQRKSQLLQDVAKLHAQKNNTLSKLIDENAKQLKEATEQHDKDVAKAEQEAKDAWNVLSQWSEKVAKLNDNCDKLDEEWFCLSRERDKLIRHLDDSEKNSKENTMQCPVCNHIFLDPKFKLAWNPEELRKDIGELTAKMNEKESMVKKLRSALGKAKEEIPPDQLQDASSELLRLKEVRTTMTSLLSKKQEESTKAATEEWDKKIATAEEKFRALMGEPTKDKSNTLLESELEVLQQKLQQIDNNAEYKSRIEKLDAQLEKLGKQAEKLQKEIWLYGQRMRIKARVIEENINQRFNIARFKLFKTLVNESVEEICEVLYNGKETMSTGEAIYVGAEIADRFANHWGIDVPLLVDGIQNITLDLPADHKQKILTQTNTNSQMEVKWRR